MANANRLGTEEDPYESSFRELEQHLYSFAKPFKAEDLTEFDQKEGQYYPTVNLEDDEKIRKLIDEYDNNTLWDELFHLLVERDMIKKYGVQKYFKMSWREKIEKEEPLRQKWDKELQRHGIRRLDICKKEN